MNSVGMAGMKPTKSLYPQTIRFSGQDDANSAEILSDDVTLIPSSGEHESGSSKVKLQNIVDFSWELRFYTGQLLAVHMAGVYVAYGIKTVGKSNGAVRVVNRANNERALLKGMQGMVQDIAFAHIPQEIVLACVDEFGSLFVHTIQETNDKITYHVLLRVEHRKEELSMSIHHRVIWCPFLPDDEDNSSGDSATYDDVAKLLVLTRGCKAELWNVSVVTSCYGNGPLFPEDVDKGFLKVEEHKRPIVDAAFSPDGVALATASLDGDVKFFQVYMHTGERPRCLHHWQPHEGKPVSALFFLDNHRCYNPDVQFWKYAVTGAENNTELKLWSCESWSCLQTIRFAPENPQKSIALKAGLDLGAGYLLLSDIYNKLLYILQIYKNSSETCAFIRSITEFSLPYPILSFGIVDAGLRTIRSSSFENVCCEEGDDEIQSSVQAVVIRMYLVQPKSLQECHIAFQPLPGISDSEHLNSLCHDSLMFKDGFTDLSKSLSRNLLEKSSGDLESSVQDISGNKSSQLNLMTPDAFSSPVKKDSPAEVISPRVSHRSDSAQLGSQILEAPLSASPSLLSTMVPQEDGILLPASTAQGEEPLATSEVLNEPPNQRETFASGGSSPSREVQQILSLNTNSDFLSDNIVDIMDPPVQLPSESSPTKETHQLASISSSTIPKDKPDGDGWPQIPLALVSDVCKSVAAPEESSGKRSSTGSGVATVENETRGHDHSILNQNQRIESMLTKMSEQLVALSQNQLQQHAQIQELRTELQQLRQASTEQHREVRIGHIEAALEQQRTTLEGLATAIDDGGRKRQDALLTALSQVLANVVGSKLGELVTSEFKCSLVPAVLNSMEPLKRQMHVELTQKLTATDHLLKENITKLVQSKSVMDVLSNSMVAALQPAMQASFKEVFSSLVLPSFEKACQNMFQQINDAFSKGTKEYLQTMDGHFDKQRRQQEKSRDVLNQLTSLMDTFHNSSDNLTGTVWQEIQRQMSSCIASIQDKVHRTVGEAVKEHIAKGFHAHKSVIEDSVITAVQSCAVTPPPNIFDSHLQQTQLLQLIAQGQINAAFQQALSAADLNLVVFVCEKVNPGQVFNQTPCPLQQHVILSLIQQLSSDMNNHTDLKHKYLEEAVMNLDPTNAITREHLPSVINNLQQQLAIYMQNNPNNKITRSVCMLHMATQSLLVS